MANAEKAVAYFVDWDSLVSSIDVKAPVGDAVRHSSDSRILDRLDVSAFTEDGRMWREYSNLWRRVVKRPCEEGFILRDLEDLMLEPLEGLEAPFPVEQGHIHVKETHQTIYLVFWSTGMSA